MLGSTYSTVKAAILDRLANVADLADATVTGAPPTDPVNVLGESGSGKAIWIASGEGSYDNTVLCGPGRLDIDETYDLTIVFQSLPLDSDDGQAVTDTRVDEMLGAFLSDMATDATFGVAASDDLPLVYITISRGSFERFSGPFTNGVLYPSRCELKLDVEARLSFP